MIADSHILLDGVSDAIEAPVIMRCAYCNQPWAIEHVCAVAGTTHDSAICVCGYWHFGACCNSFDLVTAR